MFIVQTRAFVRSKRVTLGRYPKLAPELARKEAAAVIAQIKKGQPVVPPELVPVPTVADVECKGILNFRNRLHHTPIVGTAPSTSW